MCVKWDYSDGLLAQVTELRKNCGDFRSGNGLWDSYGGMGTSWSDVVTTYLFA